eukprot:11214948-Lingulodinium_polyedra.AAC.1
MQSVQPHDVNAIHAICNMLQQRLANRTRRALHAGAKNWHSRGVCDACDLRAVAAANGGRNRIIM